MSDLVYNNSDLIFGRCCGGGLHGGGCGGYVGGKSALEHYDDGFFGTPHETKWKRGEPQEVYWNNIHFLILYLFCCLVCLFVWVFVLSESSVHQNLIEEK